MYVLMPLIAGVAQMRGWWDGRQLRAATRDGGLG
jgi:hypothetical protein